MAKTTRKKKPLDETRKTVVFKGEDENKTLDAFIKKCYKENRDFSKGIKNLIINDLNN